MESISVDGEVAEIAILQPTPTPKRKSVFNLVYSDLLVGVGVGCKILRVTFQSNIVHKWHRSDSPWDRIEGGRSHSLQEAMKQS